MMRSAPMKRTGFKPKAYPPALPQSEKPRKEKTRKCRVCRTKFEPRSMTHVACGEECALIVAEAKRLKEMRLAEKQARIQAQADKVASRTIRKWLALAEKAVNRYVRARDFFAGCISCEKGSHWDGIWHASHYKSVGSNSRLRFNLLNIHKGCDQCNRHRAGNIAEYRPRLALKIGADRVEWLDCQNGVTKYTPEYLDRLIKVMNKKALRQEKRNKVGA